MARTRTKKTDTGEGRDWSVDYADGGKVYRPLDLEIKESMRSYIDYALTERALPYIDGLKPVHRAILWCMWENNAKASSNYVKSAKVASDCIGAYHPHSQDAVYGAAAGLTRAKGDDTRVGACKLNACLIDGRGNWGASWEDPPAAARYTEQRLSKNGEACVRDTGSGAVFMNPTFDAKHTLPEVMPVRIPLLLMNGSSGLAYGYNVFWLPHNPSEAIRACIHRIENPKCSVDEIRAVMPGADFPGGGILIDREEGGLAQAYETGFGNLTLTSRYRIVRNATRSRHYIDFYETPYGVPRTGENSIVEGITTFAGKHPEYGIVDVKNLSGGENECLIEVSVKSSLNPEAVAAAMLSSSSGTKLTQTVSYRQSAVVGDFEKSDVVDATGREGILRLTSPKPRDLGMLDYIDAFIEFRHACVMNACAYEKDKAARRKHMIDGLLKALLDIDEVIAIVRRSQNVKTAHNNLKKQFKLDDEQTDYILAIPLSRLTRSDKIQLEANAKKLEEEIKRLTKIMSSRKNVLAEVKRQLNEELDKQVLPRRTTIISADGKIVAKAGESKDELSATKSIVAAVLGKTPAASSDSGDVVAPTLEATGSTAVYLTANGKVCQGSKKAPKHVQMLADVDMQSAVLIVFEDGSSTRLRACELPLTPTVLSKKAVGIVAIDDLEKPTGLVAMTTSTGQAKVLKLDTLTKNVECPVMSLAGGAKLTSSRAMEDGLFFVFVTSAANLLRFPASSVNPQGRTSGGVAGVKLPEGTHVVYAGMAKEGDLVVSATSKSIKATPLAEYPPKGRGSLGVRCQRFNKGETELAVAYVGAQPAADKVEIPPVSKRDAAGTSAEGLDKVVFHEN